MKGYKPPPKNIKRPNRPTPAPPLKEEMKLFPNSSLRNWVLVAYILKDELGKKPEKEI